MDVDVVVSDEVKPCVVVKRYASVNANEGACNRVFDRESRVMTVRRPRAYDGGGRGKHTAVVRTGARQAQAHRLTASEVPLCNPPVAEGRRVDWTNA